MDGPLSHDEVQELLGAYALDAVDEGERELVELHLLECPRCRAEVAEHRGVASFLASTGGPAPEGLWARIAGSLEEAPPRLDLAPVMPLRPHRAVSLRVGSAVAAVAAAVIGVLGFTVLDQGHRIDDLAQPTARARLAQAAGAAVLDPAARTVQLRSDDGRLTAEAVVLPDGAGYLVRSALPPLASDRTYQLWALVGTGKVSAGVLGTKPGVAAFHVDREARGFAITDEQRGGVVSSDNPPVVTGRVSEA